MSILKLKDSQGNWVGVPTIKGDDGNGISSAVLNNDYTLTLTFTDGTTYTTPSIRGEKGEQGDPATSMDIHICSSSEYDSETRIPTITNPNDKTFYLVPSADGTSPDLFTEWVYVNNAWEMFGSASVDLSGYLTDVTVDGTSVVTDGVAEIPIASVTDLGVAKYDPSFGVTIVPQTGMVALVNPTNSEIKNGTSSKGILVARQHESTFYGLAKVSGHDEKNSTLPVGQYTNEAKSSIQNMLDVPSNADLDEVEEKVEQNTEDLLKAYPTDTASGNIASFEDGANDIPLQSLVVDIEPVQDLHGYDAPWVGGSGKNKFDPSVFLTTTGWTENNGVYTGNADDLNNKEFASLALPYLGQVAISFEYINDNENRAGYVSITYSDESVAYIEIQANKSTWTSKTTVTEAGKTVSKIRFASSNNNVTISIRNMQIELGSAVTSWTPYENICPISGWTGVRVWHTGRNVSYKAITGFVSPATEYAMFSASKGTTLVFRCKKDETYIVSGLAINRYVYGIWNSEPESGDKTTVFKNIGETLGTAFTIPKDGVCLIYVNSESVDTSSAQIELGSTATSYEPYTGHSITIDLGQTVYGGSLDVLSGVLTVDKKAIDLANIEFVRDSAGYFQSRANAIIINDAMHYTSGEVANLICSQYTAKTVATVQNNNGSCGIYWYANDNRNILRIRDDRYSDAQSFMTAMSGVQLVYELAEPITYQLTPQEVKSLLGVNNIFANTGDTEVEYRADPDLYIQRKMPDVPVEDVQINGQSIVENGVANVPIGGTSNLGVFKVNGNYGTGSNNGTITISAATSVGIKNGANGWTPLIPARQHESTFYGLTKAAGVDMSSSSNAVGTYTDEAKTAIKQMLGVKDNYDSFIVDVDGTDPVITGQPSYRYNCGELYSLTVTPPSSGTIDFRFTSGSTPTVLTLPSTVKMPEWWVEVEANTIYEMCITDGVYCGVMSWAM